MKEAGTMDCSPWKTGSMFDAAGCEDARTDACVRSDGAAGGEAVAAPALAAGDAWRSLCSAQDLVCGFGDRSHGPPRLPLLTVKQVHGTRLISADGMAAGASPVEADGIQISRPGLLAAVRTADCVPVLLVAEAADSDVIGVQQRPRRYSRRWAAAVHAGWRGSAAGIVDAAVDAAASAGHEASSLWALLGPGIGPCCYQVGEEVAVRFRTARLPVKELDGVTRLDLREINRFRLLSKGLRADRIALIGPCTKCACEQYFSYRAQPGEGGRQLSWIGWADRKLGKDR